MNCPNCNAVLPELELNDTPSGDFHSFTCPACNVRREFYIEAKRFVLVPLTSKKAKAHPRR